MRRLRRMTIPVLLGVVCGCTPHATTPPPAAASDDPLANADKQPFLATLDGIEGNEHPFFFCLIAALSRMACSTLSPRQAVATASTEIPPLQATPAHV